MQTLKRSFQRETTRQQYKYSMTKVAMFAEYFAMPALPMSAAQLKLLTMWLLIEKNLDSSTVGNVLNAVGDWHDYVRQTMQSAAPPRTNMIFESPMRNEEMRQIKDTMQKTLKKASKATESMTVAELRAVFDEGFNGDAHGRHHRMSFTLTTLGMLRQKAATLLKIKYGLVQSATGTEVVFDETSDVKILYDPDLQEEYIELAVDVDKNVDARNPRKGYIPAHIPGLGIHPVRELKDYITSMRPPSNGYLLAAPKTKSVPPSFRETRFTAMGGVFTKAYKKLFPTSTKKVSSHSGRKTLAQLLWDMGYCKRIIADAGGWFLKKDAVDLYFKTARRIILKAISSLGAAHNRAPQSS